MGVFENPRLILGCCAQSGLSARYRWKVGYFLGICDEMSPSCDEEKKRLDGWEILLQVLYECLVESILILNDRKGFA